MLKYLPICNIVVLIGLGLSSISYGQVSRLTEPRPTIWKKTNDKEDIVIYEGNVLKDGAVPLKGHVIINHPIEKVVAAMADTQGKKKWLPAVSKISVLEKPNSYLKTEYFVVEMPFIVSDRTTALTSIAKVSEDKKEIIVSIKSSNKFPEKNDDYIRAQMDFGEVRLRSVADGKKTIVAGIFYTNPKGFLPNWVVKRFTRKFVYESLVKLRHRVGRNLYDTQVINSYARLIDEYSDFHTRGIATSKKEQ